MVHLQSVKRVAGLKGLDPTPSGRQRLDRARSRGSLMLSSTYLGILHHAQLWEY